MEGIQHKLLVKLLDFNYKVEYKKGRENKLAGALSRASHSTDLMLISQAVPVWMEKGTATYETNEECLELITKWSIDQMAVALFSLKDNIVRYNNKVYIGNTGQLQQ